MNMTSYFKIILILLIPVFMQAQPLKEIPYRFMLEAAEAALASGDYYNAVEWFEKCYKEQRNKDMAINIAGLYMKLRDYKRAENWYKRVLSKDKDMLYIDDRFEYGKALKYLGRYNDAYAEFMFFIDSSTNEALKPNAQMELDGMLQAKTLEENNDAIITLLDKKINSGMTEFGPMESSDGSLYFSSFQTNKVIILDGKEEDVFAKIYTTSQTDKGYSKPKALPAAINRAGFHTGNVAFSSDGRRMFFTRSTLSGGEIVTSQLFVSNRKNKGWAPPMEISNLNGNHSIKHPAAGELYGKEVLFFSANMDGGEGGFDIYYSTIQGDDLATAVNLGESINTEADEITPYYIDGELFFSSEGYPTLGGFDIFKTSWNGSNWSEVSNLGMGYNSSCDDLYFTQFNGGMNGYLVSNRPSEKKRSLKSKTCCDDIYSFGIRQLIIDLIAVTENEEGPMKGAEVTLVDLSGELIDPITKSNETLDEYSFLLDADKPYKLVFKKKGYYPDSLDFNTVGILDDYTINKKKVLKMIPVIEKDPVDEVIEIVTINQAIRLDNIYYDLDDDKILVDAEKDLNTLLGLLNQYPDMVIELSSHTDAQGAGPYNKRLSARRAESAKNWLLDEGIDDDRIQTVGYGESQILNKCVNGVKCRDSEHRVNRRTEFKILEGPQTIEIRKEVPRTKASQGGLQSFGINNGPKIEIYGSNVDLGKLKRGETRSLSFTYKNVGDEALEIEIMTTCHCTTLEWSKAPLAPGESATIKAIYDSGAKEESREYREVINIISNAANIVDEAIFTVTVID